MNYGLLTDARGCPVAVSVFEGNTADPKTLLPQVEKVRDRFGIASLIMVGDRGMISNVQIEAMRKMEGTGWITALKSGAASPSSRMAGNCSPICLMSAILSALPAKIILASTWWPAAIRSLLGCAQQDAGT